MGISIEKSFLLPHLMTLKGITNWPSQVPTMAQVNEFIPELCKVPYDYLFRDDPVAMAECSLLVHEYTGLDNLSANLDFYNFEAESVGAKIAFFKDHIPDIDRNDFLIKDEKDFGKIKFNGLDAGRLPYLIQYSKAYTEYTGIPSFPSFSAPWTLACNLYGLENLIVDTMTEPEFVHELLRRIVEDLHAPMFRAFNEVLPGLTKCSFADAFASPPMTNMAIIREFVEPYLNLEAEAVGIEGVGVTDGGIWGVTKISDKDRPEFLDFIIRTNSMLVAFDPDVYDLGPEFYRNYADEKRVGLMLGLSTGFLQQETADEVVERVKHYVLAGKSGITPFMFFFNNFAPHTPVENIHAAMAAVQTYGAPGATADTPFRMPVRESFEDFLKSKIADNKEGYTFQWLKESGYSYLS